MRLPCPLWVKSGCAVQNVMSALTPKADMCSAPTHVRFVPIADIASRLFDHLVGATRQRKRDSDAQRLGGLEV